VRLFLKAVVGVGALLSLTACALVPERRAVDPPVNAITASARAPEAELLDVGVQVFDAGLEDLDGNEQGVYPEVRRAESHYIPFHLAKTLQSTGHWGAVRVVPTAAEEVDVVLHGRIMASDGEKLVLRIRAVDVTGREWFYRQYETTADARAYEGLKKGKTDPFQALYNAIANDMYATLQDLDAAERAEIRRVGRLRFAADIAPYAFNGYLEEDDGTYHVLRLPAESDPMAARIDRIHARERMFIDTVNRYYADYYGDLWQTYVDWREAYRWQAENEREQGPRSNKVMLVGGYEVYRASKGYAPDALVYTTAFSGLKASFGPRVEPLITEVEGRTVELSGSYEEQFRQWRELLRELFAAERGAERSSAAVSSQ
jgi:hypothetical protein